MPLKPQFLVNLASRAHTAQHEGLISVGQFDQLSVRTHEHLVDPKVRESYLRVARHAVEMAANNFTRFAKKDPAVLERFANLKRELDRSASDVPDDGSVSQSVCELVAAHKGGGLNPSERERRMLWTLLTADSLWSSVHTACAVGRELATGKTLMLPIIDDTAP